jgi:hypothetical protein
MAPGVYEHLLRTAESPQCFVATVAVGDLQELLWAYKKQQGQQGQAPDLLPDLVPSESSPCQ